MERHVKERLIGAAVLVALAVILIPELLSGPERASQPAAVTTNEQGIKTYQFDLNARAPATTTQTREDVPAKTVAQLPPPDQTSAPPPEVIEPAPIPRNEQADVRRSSEPEPVAAVPRRPTPDRVSAATTSPEPTRPQKPPATPPARIEKGWAVQIGSFQDESRANALVQRMSGDGHRAYLVPLKRADGKVLQRVRIGPYKERSEAEGALKKIGDLGKGAAIVSEG